MRREPFCDNFSHPIDDPDAGGLPSWRNAGSYSSDLYLYIN